MAAGGRDQRTPVAGGGEVGAAGTTGIVPRMTELGICESCGREDEEIVAVQRYYITPAAGGTEEKVEAGDVEHWCFVCRTHYPHALLDDTEAADPPS